MGKVKNYYIGNSLYFVVYLECESCFTKDLSRINILSGSTGTKQNFYYLLISYR